MVAQGFGYGYPSFWSRIPVYVGMSDHVRGYSWCISFDISLVLYAVSLVLYDACLFFMILLPFLWYFDDTSLAFFWKVSFLYNVMYQIYKLIFSWKMRLWDFFREKTFLRVRVCPTVNLKKWWLWLRPRVLYVWDSIAIRILRMPGDSSVPWRGFSCKLFLNLSKSCLKLGYFLLSRLASLAK